MYGETLFRGTRKRLSREINAFSFILFCLIAPTMLWSADCRTRVFANMHFHQVVHKMKRTLHVSRTYEFCSRGKSNICLISLLISFPTSYWFLYIIISVSNKTHEFIIYAMYQRARADNLTICYRKNQIDVSFSCMSCHWQWISS